MQHRSDQTDNPTTASAEEAPASTVPHREPLARLARFFRPHPVSGELPAPEEDPGEPTAEFNVLDMRGGEGHPAFPLALWGGYDREAVDARVAELERELEELRAKLDPERGVEAEIQHLGDETAEILRVAHGKADALVKKAAADAEILEAQTETRVAELLADAQERADAMVTEAAERLRRLDDDTDDVWADRTRLIEDTRRLGEQLMRVAESAVERFPPETDAPADEAPADDAPAE